MKKERKIYNFGISLFLYYFPLILLILFVLYPLFALILKGFYEDGHFTLSFYQSVVSAQSFKTSLNHSLEVAFVVSLISVFVAISYTMVLHYSKSKFLKALLLLVILISLISPPFISSLSYIQLYGRRGLITNGIFHLSISPYNVFGIIIMQVISFAPFNVMFLLGFLKNIKKNTVDASRSLGANDKRIFFDIITPTIRRALLSIFVLTFIRSISDYATPIVIGGRYNTIASDIYLQMVGYSNLNKVSVLNMSIMIPSFIAFFIYLECTKRISTDENMSYQSVSLKSFKIAKIGVLGFLMYAITFFVFLASLLQYLSIFFSSIFKYTKNGYKFTNEYLKKFASSDFSALVRSVTYTLIVILISLVLSLLVSYYLSRFRSKKGKLTEALILLPYTIAGPTFGIGYILAFNHRPLYITGTALIVILNMTFKQFPISYRIINDAVRSISYNQDRSALSLGASRLRVLKDIIIPEMKEGVRSLFVYNFSTSMTTAGSIIFLITPRSQLLVFSLFDAVYVGDYGRASVIASTIILVVGIVELLFLLLLKSGKRSRRSYVFNA